MSSSESMESANAPFQRLTADNHGPAVMVAAYIFLISSILAVVVKIWTRISTTWKLAMTDYAILLSIIFATAQTVVLTISLDRGLGRHAEAVSDSQLESLSKAFYASNILLPVALGGAKASIIFLIISIKPARPIMLACYGVLGFSGVWTIAAALAFAFQCSIPQPWVLGPDTALGPQSCVDQYALQLGVGVINILTDLVIVALPFFMMQNVQVAAAKRWVVSALFGLRILTPAFAVCALVTFHTYYHSVPQDRTWHIVAPAVWTQVMLNTSIMTACIPSIKRFLADIQSGAMGVNISEPFELTHSGGKYVDYGNGTTFGSKVATRLGLSMNSGIGKSQNSHSSQGRSKNEKSIDMERSAGHHQFLSPGPNLNRGQNHRDTSDSIKGLTDDVIMQTIDYKVEYEDGHSQASEGGRSSRSVHGHGAGRHGPSYEVGVGR